MNEQLKEFFEDLEEKNLRKINNIVVRDGKRVQQDKPQFVRYARRQIIPFKIDDTPYIGKEASTDTANYIHELSSSKLFGDLGIITPPTYPIRIKTSKSNTKIGLISQDVNHLKDIFVQPATTISLFEHLPIKPQFGGYRNLSPWHIFTDKTVKQKCLEIMTEKCYEDITNYFLLEELRSSCDTHKGNYFLYKHNENGKFKGVIPIDLENSTALSYENIDKDMFDYFIHNIQYPSCLPFKNFSDIGEDGNFGNYVYTMSYSKRIEMIKLMISKGLLSDNQIELLKNAINYDFPAVVKDTCNNLEKHTKESSRNYTIDTISRLWEYNHNQLDKELQ